MGGLFTTNFDLTYIQNELKLIMNVVELCYFHYKHHELLERRFLSGIII